MKFLVFSDLHQEEAALEKLRGAADGFDYVLSCGDNSRSVSFLEEVIGSFPRFYFIPGNWEGEKENEFIAGNKNSVNERRVELEDGLNLVGFGYSNITPFGTYGELSEEEIYERMNKLEIDNNTVLLLHCPPKGHFDSARGKHAGSSSVLRIIEEKKPLVVFFGHIHEEEGMGRIEGTNIIKVPAANRFRACAVEIENKRITSKFIDLG